MGQLNFCSTSSMQAFPEQDKTVLTVGVSSQDALFIRVDGERIPSSRPEHLLGMFMFYPTPTSQQLL